MSFWKRVFSADYRRAIAAEAAGDFVGAAKAYALAGERAKVADMLFERARRAPTPESRLVELRSAVGWADGEHPEAKAARRRLARAFAEWAAQSGLVSEADRDVLREAAALHASVGEHREAAECYDRTGDALKAAQALEASGDVERLETLFVKEDHKRRREARQHEALEDYRVEYRSGHRRRAREALQRGLESEVGEASASGAADRLELRRFIKDLDDRRLGGSLLLDGNGAQRQRLIAGDRLIIGREPACHLLLNDAGISRQHARIEWTDAGLQLRDLGARNGTRWRGLTVAGAIPIDGQGELELGPEGRLLLEPKPGEVTISVLAGSQRGLEVRWGRPHLLLVEGVQLRLDDAGWLQLVIAHEVSARLNDLPVAGEIELLDGDLLLVGTRRFGIHR